MNPLRLSAHELATILAALRYWQEEMSPHPTAAADPEYFAEIEPLSAREIDDLCARLHCEGSKA